MTNRALAASKRHTRFKKLYEEDGLTLGMIAEKFGISRQAVNQTLNPQKHKMRQLTAYRIKQGKLIRPRLCIQCSQPGRVEGHHQDYSVETVTWLCKSCHTKAHL